MRSTDRDYLYKRLVRLSDRYPLQFVGNMGVASRLYEDARYVIGRIHSTFHHSYRENIWSHVRFPEDIDVAYAYGQFPRRAPSELPVVWQQTFAWIPGGPDLDTWVKSTRQSRAPAVRRADLVVVPSRTSLEHFVELFPWAQDKIEVLPYYFPEIEPLQDDILDAKHTDPGPLRVLFVGKRAKRKGLATLVRAWSRLSDDTSRSMDVTIVTPFLDGSVVLPSPWTHFVWVEDIFRVMAEAHLLVFPTEREAYGLVLPEAMAHGVGVVTTDAPVQRDIVPHAGGLFIAHNDDRALAAALTELAQEREKVTAMARANVARFRTEFWHEIVGPAHLRVFSQTALTGRRH